VTVTRTASIAPDATVVVGGPKGREVYGVMHGRTATFTVGFRSAAERKHVVVVLGNGHTTSESYLLRYRSS
jgi:pyruvate/2-oxoacid:ferredoxin oxidoreductase beta subunit